MSVLYLVATPLGNLEDITLRAIRVLKEADSIAAESLQRAGQLLRHLGIKPGQLISCRESNRKQAAEAVCNLLGQGKTVALISDAGSPGLNDPAAAVVARVSELGYPVSPVPGPSALAAAWSVAGIDHAPFIMLGFLPAKSGAKERLLNKCRESGWPFVFFEAPHRILLTAHTLAALMPERKLTVCREMTKLHEQILTTTCQTLPRQLADDPNLSRGEFTIVVDGGMDSLREGNDSTDIKGDLRQMLHISRGLSTSQLASFLSKELKLPRELVYKEMLALKNHS